MTPKEIIKSVPTDAPSSTTKPKNNLWTWAVGVLTVACVVLWGVTMQNNKQTLKEKDTQVAIYKMANQELREDNAALRKEINECNADKLMIQGEGQRKLIEFLELKQGRKQTISIQPKPTTNE